MKPVALATLVAAAAAAALLPRSCGTSPADPPAGPPVDPPLPTASKAELMDLRKRVLQANKSFRPGPPPPATAAARDAALREHDAVLAAVEALGSCAPSEHAELLKLYEHVGYGISWRGDGDGGQSVRAARLASLNHRLRRLHPERDYPVESTRIWAQSCLQADDLQQLAAAIEFGKARPGGDPLEHVLLQLLEARLYCQLGRLENASDLVAAAENAFEHATLQQPPPSPQRVLGTRVEVARTQADVFLLCSDPERAEKAIALLPPSTERDLYAAHAAAMQRRPEAAAELEALTEVVDKRIARSALEKLVQLQLHLDQDDEALNSLKRLLACAVPGARDTEQRSIILQMELALRGKLPVDESLRQAGRSALDRLLQRWRAAPALRGGIGFLHLDDRATLVQGLMRVEAALSPDTPATAALDTLVRVQAQSIGVAAATEATAILPQFVGAQRGLLVLVPGRFGSLALSFDAQGGTITPLADGAELRRQALELRASAVRLLQQASPADSLAELARAGRALLPQTLRNHLESLASVSVCGAGMLDGLPFELLALGTEDTPCGLRQAITYEDNLIVGANRSPTRSGAGVAFLGSLRATVGNSASAGMPVEAVEACLAAYPGRPHTTILCDQAATPAAIRTALARFGIIHIVAHGCYAGDRPDPNGLVLGDEPGDQLFAAHLEGCDLSGAIVLLGACEVGSNPYRRGGDSLAPSIVGAMLQAGARCVLAATTDIDLFRHLESMAVVHRALRDGRPIAEAVLRARKQATSTSAQIEMLLMRLHGRGD